MKDLLTKFTLYDVIGTFIPGFISVVCIISLYPEVVKICTEIINSNWIVTISVLIISYCFGWFLSELSKMIFVQLDLLHKNQLSFAIAILICSIIMNIFKKKCSLDLYFIMLFYFVLTILAYKKNNKSLEYEVLYNKIAKLYTCMSDEFEQLKKNIVSPYYLIQTDEKYNRIHNYCSSKVFSKNMSISCVILGITSFIHYINTTEYVLLFYNMTLFSILSTMVFYQRYKAFEIKVNLVVCIFFIDSLERKGVYL